MDNVKFYREEWQNTIFSDKNQFNVDVPDGNAHKWHHLCHDERINWTRTFGGSSVMTWACFSYLGRSGIVFLNGKQDSECYINTLETFLIPMYQTCHEEDWVFQQDNASFISQS